MMAMHKSEELREVVGTIFNQLQILGLDAPGSNLIIYNEDLAAEHWMTGFSDSTYPESYKIPYVDHPYFTDLLTAWQNGVPFQEFYFEGDLKIEYARWCLEHSDFKRLPPEFKKEMVNPDRMVISDAFNKYGMIEILGLEPLPEESVSVLKRISMVFEQTYTRFLDLQKAEALAREAQIEAALERVRSRSMGMHKSEELKEVVKVIFDQLAHLGINAEHAGIVVDYEPEKDWHFWIAETQDIPAKVTVPYLNLAWDRQFTEAKKEGRHFFTTQMDFEEKNSFYKELLPHIEGLTKRQRNFISVVRAWPHRPSFKRISVSILKISPEYLIQRRTMISLYVLLKFFSRPIPVSSICKEPKPRPGKPRSKRRLKGFDHVRWPCIKVTSSQMWPLSCINS